MNRALLRTAGAAALAVAGLSCGVACGNAPEPDNVDATPSGGKSNPGGGSGGSETGGGGDTAGPGGGGSGGEHVNQGGDGNPVQKVFDAGSDPNRNAIAPGQLCERLSTIQCAGEHYCCENPGRDVSACQAAMLQLCRNDLHLDAVMEAQSTSFDAERARTAFERFEEMASQCDTNVAAWGSSLDGLRGITRGTLEPGASCFPGIAAALNPSRGAISLASCNTIETHACLPTSVSQWTCSERAGEGSACFSDNNCVDGLFCDNPELQVAAGTTCKPRKADGEGCATPNECMSLMCKGGQCVPADRQAAYCLAN